MSTDTGFDYRKTVNLPNTDFPQRASLSTREPERLQQWRDMGLYEKILTRPREKEYVLHDGPPYANGDIHMGHALNKVLKDFVVRYKTMTGHRAHYVPGWDCHGLPIEAKVVGDLRASGEYESKSPLEIRKLCGNYAQKWIDVQREQFQRLGVTGDWYHPYVTMDPKFEVEILRGFLELVKKGLVYKGMKVVHWDPVFETALAEAEIEYSDEHVSPSIYVRFPFVTTPPVPELQGDKVSVVIWTTTPWTLPANLGVCLHPQFEYVAYKVGDETLVLAKELLARFKEDTGLDNGSVVATFSGKELDRQKCKHPLLDKESLVMLADHVTLEDGTGCVHTAPGHGVEDFHVGQEYGLPVFNPVDEKGCYTAEYPEMQGVMVFDANPAIVETLRERGILVHHAPYKHRYPYSWRSKKPVIMRASEQWFMSIDKDGLRQKALKETDNVKWVPNWGYDRIYNMLKGRPDWCLSRQRAWGVPIPSLHDKEKGESVLLPEVIEKFANYVADEGTDAWYARPVEDFLPDSMKGDASRYEKEHNTFDVWYDSGSTHLAVLNDNYALSWPADLYLEGSDQHRGWFQSSMWVSLGARDTAPYRTVLTHGFVLDENGRAMSKSLGNVISPLKVMDLRGADVLRLWVASEDYRADVSISTAATELPQGQGKRGKGAKEDWGPASTYRRIRNTVRFLLGNLYDFDPNDALPYDQLGEDDRWILDRLEDLIERVTAAYENFQFHMIYQMINGFCVTELGSLYLDITKDRLYCSGAADRPRRASQTVMYELASSLARMLAPMTPFTADEAWEFLPGDRELCVHLADFPTQHPEWRKPELAQKFERLLVLRRAVTSAIEPLRQGAEKIIGNSLDAKVVLKGTDPESIAFVEQNKEFLPSFFIVSQVEASKEETGEISEEMRAVGLHLTVEVKKAEGEKCPRCWTWSTETGQDAEHPALCRRCADAVRRMPSHE